MQAALDYLLTLDIESYTRFMYFWLALGVAAGIGIYIKGELPISSKVDNYSQSLLGSIDKRLGWIIMEIPILLTVLFFYFSSEQRFDPSTVILGLFVLHYTNRALIYPYRIKTEGKRMPVSSMLFSMVFYAVNGYLIGYYFGALKSYPVEWLWDPRFLVGVALFFSGFIINIQSDNILINLRKPGETEYKIPQGGFYRWISCPNYFGETIEWIGFALMSWCLPGFVYAVWVGLPLFSQALLAHKWYLEKFGQEYPNDRKAFIPFIL